MEQIITVLEPAMIIKTTRQSVYQTERDLDLNFNLTERTVLCQVVHLI